MEIGCIISILMIVAFGLGIGFGYVLTMNSDFEYQEASFMTCNYANNLTTVINMQSDLLHLCSGMNYTRLQYLNCTQLKR